MKKTVFLAGIFAAALLTGCGEDKPLDSTSSTSTSSTSSTSSSTSSTTSSSSSTTSSSSSTTSSSSTSSSTTSSELVPDWYPGSTSTSSTSTEPTQSTSSSTTSTTTSTSTSTTPAPDPKPTPSSSSTFSSQPTPDPVTKYWTPDAPGCTPGPYGGYYDAGGNLHCKEANMPTDEHGAPLISYYDERGSHYLTYEEDLKAAEEERRISAGGTVDLSDIDWSLFP